MTGRTLPIVALAGLLVGCQGPGPIASHNATVSTLKTSVSQLEFKNDELTKQVAELKSENGRYEDRLVQEQAENDRLANQVDKGRRYEEIQTGSRSSGSGDSSADDPAPTRSRGTSRPPRKPPAASIPGRIEPADDLGYDPPPPRRLASRRQDSQWLPVAQGVGSGQGTVK